MRNSNDYRADDAINRIASMKTAEEIKEFIEAEDRKTVLSAADTRISEIASAAPRNDIEKQGEQKDPITQKKDDFKEGIQRTKSGDSPEAHGKSGTLPTDLGSVPFSPRNYVTCEDVIEKMRAEGKKI